MIVELDYFNVPLVFYLVAFTALIIFIVGVIRSDSAEALICLILTITAIIFTWFLPLIYPGYADEDSLKKEAKETYGLELIKKSDSNENEYIFNNPDLDSNENCKVEFLEEIENHPVRVVANGRDKEAEAILICNGEEPEKAN